MAADSGPAAVPPASPGPAPKVTPEARYNEAQDFAAGGAWAQAESAYRNATEMRADFPEAWNGLGHSLKMQRKYPEALEAYGRALALRPNYPEAIEYLGETYVAMGRAEDANAALAKLEPLDANLAGKLRAAISDGKPSSAW